jgi:hypothetical protein
MFSQYWLLALTVGFEHGEPGWLAAAAGTACVSNATEAANSQSKRCFTRQRTGPSGC